MFGTDISIDDLFGNFSLIIALGLKGAPGIVTAAVIEIEVTPFNLSTPPIAFKWLSKIFLTVTLASISLAKTGLSIWIPTLL